MNNLKRDTDSFSLLSSFKNLLSQYKKERSGYRLVLSNVEIKNDLAVTLSVLVDSIKKDLITFDPSEIVFNDKLLSEFSPCDVRAITFLSLQKFIKFDINSVVITGQSITEGKTTFDFFDYEKNEITLMSALEAYQDYDLLYRMSRKDMIVVISTAVQEQSIQDFKSMETV